MTAKQLMDLLVGEKNLGKPTVDTCKHGDENRELRKVGVCLTATPDVLRAAADWGADLLITHECTYYDHFDSPRPDPITAKKRELVASCPFTLWRFHDFIHSNEGRPDGIHVGFLESLGVPYRYDGSRFADLATETTPRELAKRISEKLGVPHPRIAGDPDLPVRRIALYLGACGGSFDAFASDDAQLAIAGELCEWREVEPIRDAAQLGVPKALLLLGHAASEEPGMALLADGLQTHFPALDVRFFPCGPIVTYAE